MKPEVAALLAENAGERRRRLSLLDIADRKRLIEELIEDFFVVQRATLLKWSALTGQSAQIDTGYIAQHMASVVLAEPGQGFKGKGVDLANGGEVKSAAVLSGVDRPRWNHNMGTPIDDRKRASRGLGPKWQAYVDAPLVFYVLFDRDAEESSRLRVRAWCVDTQQDEDWRDLVIRFVEARGPDQYNLQLHPPIGYADDVVVNTLGNLDFVETKVFEVTFSVPITTDESLNLGWVMEPSDAYRAGRTRKLEYGGRGARPSRIEGIDSHTLDDEAVIKRLFSSLA